MIAERTHAGIHGGTRRTTTRGTQQQWVRTFSAARRPWSRRNTRRTPRRPRPVSAQAALGAPSAVSHNGSHSRLAAERARQGRASVRGAQEATGGEMPALGEALRNSRGDVGVRRERRHVHRLDGRHTPPRLVAHDGARLARRARTLGPPHARIPLWRQQGP